MRLTRRDAVLSLLVGASASTGAYGLTTAGTEQAARSDVDADAVVPTLVSVAEVIYPSAVTGTETFVEEYFSRLPDRRQASVAAAADELDSYALRTRGTRFADISAENGDSVLRSLGVDRTGGSSDGDLPERVRYYVVNQLLYGLYTSPKGGRLLGIQNPVGHPGGYESYQKPPAASGRTTPTGESTEGDG